MIDWICSIDGWTWVKVACLMALAVGGGTLKHRLFDEELREAETERQREQAGRFTDPFGT